MRGSAGGAHRHSRRYAALHRRRTCVRPAQGHCGGLPSGWGRSEGSLPEERRDAATLGICARAQRPRAATVAPLRSAVPADVEPRQRLCNRCSNSATRSNTVRSGSATPEPSSPAAVFGTVFSDTYAALPMQRPVVSMMSAVPRRSFPHSP